MQAYEGNQLPPNLNPLSKVLTPQLCSLIRAFYLCEPFPLSHRDNSWLILCEDIINNNPQQPEQREEHMQRTRLCYGAPWPLGENSERVFIDQSGLTNDT